MQTMPIDPTTGLPSPFVKTPNTELSDAASDPGSQFIAKAQASQIESSLEPEHDPLKDLTPFERAAKDQFARNPQKQDKTAIYFGPGFIDKTNEQIVLDSYAPKLKALDAASEMVGQEQQAKTRQDIISGIEGAGVSSDLQAGVDPGRTVPGTIGSPEWDETNSQNQKELGGGPDEPKPHDLEAPNKAQMWLGLILAVSSGFQALPEIAQAMFQTADDRRQFLDKADQAKFSVRQHGHEKVLSSLQQHLKTIEQRDAALYRGQVSTANNVRTTETSRDNAAGVQAGQDRRQAARIGSEMEKLQKRFEHEDNKKGQDLLSEFEGRKKIVRAAYPEISDEQVDEKAAKYVNSKVEGQVLTNIGRGLDNTLKAKTLSTNIGIAEQKLKNLKYTGHYIQTRDKYTQEMTKYIPQNEAFKWASMLAMMDFRDRSLDLQEERLDDATDSSILKTFESGYNNATENVGMYEQYLRSGIDADGAELTPETRAKYEKMKGFYEGLAEAAEKKLEGAQRDAEMKKAVSQEKRGARKPVFGRGKPAPMKGGFPNTSDASKFKPGQGIPPMTDPMAPGVSREREGGEIQKIIDRLTGGAQSNSNPYLDGIV